MRCVAALLVGAIGCGESTPTSFDFATTGIPALVAVKTGSAAWKVLQPATRFGDEAASYSIPFASELRLLVVCTFANGRYVATEMLAGTDDLDLSLESYYLPDCRSDAAYRVTGMAHDNTTTAKQVVIYDTSKPGYTADFTYDLMPHAPIVDVMLYDPQNVAIVHDVDLTQADLIEVDVDLTASQNLLMGSYSFDPVDPDEKLQALSTITTKNGSFALFTPAPGTYVRPVADVLVEGDRTSTVLEALTGDGDSPSREIEYAADDAPDHWTWLPRLANATLDPIGTAATFPPVTFAFTGAELSCQASTTNSSEVVFASSAWLATHGDPSIALDTTVPGWDPAWVIGAGRSCYLYVEQRQSQAMVKKTYAPLTTPATAATATRASYLERARRRRSR